MIDFTIIIPHKNTPQLLERCLSSIPDSSAIQIVVIDDNSSFSVVDYLKSITNMYSNAVFIFSKESKGAGYARNIGINEAKGKWILFSDADDYFLDNAFDILGEYVNSDSDLIYFSSCSVYSDTKKIANRHLYYNQLIDSFLKKELESEDFIRYNFGVPWCKMISRKLIIDNNIRFDEIRYSNDIMFSLKIGYLSKIISADYRVVYCATVTKGSLVNIRSSESLKCRYMVVLRQNKFLRSIGKYKCQRSIAYYLRSSLRYGIPLFMYFIYLSLVWKSSLFIGYKKWIKSAVTLKWLNHDNEDYVIYK